MAKWKNINIIFEDNHLLVILKPVNMAVQADNSQDLDLLTILKDYIKETYHKPGNVYLGLVHRLDRPVGGVMVFAKTSKAAARLSKQMQDNQFNKKYLALVHGKMDKESERIENYLLKDESTNTSRVVDQDQGKLAILEYHVKWYDEKNDLSLLDINLYTGRHHQIRVQLVNINHPIYGDQRYGKDLVGIQIHLWAYYLSFKHPVKDEILTFERIPNWADNYE